MNRSRASGWRDGQDPAGGAFARRSDEARWDLDNRRDVDGVDRGAARHGRICGELVRDEATEVAALRLALPDAGTSLHTGLH